MFAFTRSRSAQPLARNNPRFPRSQHRVRPLASVDRLEDRTLLSTGGFDSTFGAGGIVISTVPQPAADYASTAILQPDHKILVAGTTANQQSSHVLVVTRFNLDGTRDAGFGSNGIASLPFDGQFSEVGGLAIDRQGRIIVAGSASVVVQIPNQVATGFAVTRLTKDGQLDTSFGTAGVQTLNFGGSSAQETGVAIDNQGRIVLAGNSDQNGNARVNFAVARLGDTGQLDSSFGSGGKQIVDMGADTVSSGVVIDGQQRIVIGGLVFLPSASSGSFAVARLDAAGGLDSSFGPGGKAVLELDDGTPESFEHGR